MEVNLVLLKKNGTTKSFALPSGVTVIGRQQNCGVCIPLSTISRQHCTLILEDQQLTVRDLGSRNGTFINDDRIKEAVVNGGDVLRIGPVKFVLQLNGQPDSFEHYLAEAAKAGVSSGLGDSFVGGGESSDMTEIFYPPPQGDVKGSDMFFG